MQLKVRDLLSFIIENLKRFQKNTYEVIIYNSIIILPALLTFIFLTTYYQMEQQFNRNEDFSFNNQSISMIDMEACYPQKEVIFDHKLDVNKKFISQTDSDSVDVNNELGSNTITNKPQDESKFIADSEDDEFFDLVNIEKRSKPDLVPSSSGIRNPNKIYPTSDNITSPSQSQQISRESKIHKESSRDSKESGSDTSRESKYLLERKESKNLTESKDDESKGANKKYVLRSILSVPVYELWLVNGSMFGQLIGPFFSILLFVQLVFPSYAAHLSDYYLQAPHACSSNFFLTYNSETQVCSSTQLGSSILVLHLIFEILFVFLFSKLYCLNLQNQYDIKIGSRKLNTCIVWLLTLMTCGVFLYVTALFRTVVGILSPEEIKSRKYREKISLYANTSYLDYVDPAMVNGALDASMEISRTKTPEERELLRIRRLFVYWKRMNLLNFFTENLLEVIIIFMLFASNYFNLYSYLFCIPMFISLGYRIMVFIMSYFNILLCANVDVIQSDTKGSNV